MGCGRTWRQAPTARWSASTRSVRSQVKALSTPTAEGAAEVPVGGRRPVDRSEEVEVLDDRERAQVEHVGDRPLDAEDRHALGVEGLDVQAHGLRLADGVGDLDLAPAGQARRHDVLRHPAHRVRGRAVDLRGVLARERATTVPGHPAVGVDDDLATGEAGIPHRPADLEAPRGVDEGPVAGHVEVGPLVGQLLEDGLDDVVLDVRRQQVGERDVGRVLRREHDGVEADGPHAVVLDGDLGLAVGAQVGHLTGLAHRREPLGEPVREVDRQRHQLGGVLAGVAEHQPLVAGPLLVERVDAARAALDRGVDSLGDVRALLADGRADAAGRAVEALRGAVVADREHGVADDLRDLDVRLGRHLARPRGPGPS